jgi:hypothetical protein
MKVIFAMYIESSIDLITNSSSELFVTEGNTKESVMQMLDSIEKCWVKEYAEPKRSDELTIDELNTYFEYACSPYKYPAKKSNYPVLKGFTFDELYEKVKDNEKLWYREESYRLKNNTINPRWEWDQNFVTEENKEEILNKLDPERKMWFIYSFGDNPDWELQKKLMNVAQRFHLG